MKISQLLNEGKIGRKQRRKDAIEYLDTIIKPKEGRQHLTWKEKRREKALRQKNLVKGLTNEEIIEYNDLNFVEVINTGYALNSKTEVTYKRIRDKQKGIKKNRISYLPRRIQTRSITQMYKQDIEKVKEESLKETY